MYIISVFWVFLQCLIYLLYYRVWSAYHGCVILALNMLKQAWNLCRFNLNRNLDNNPTKFEMMRYSRRLIYCLPLIKSLDTYSFYCWLPVDFHRFNMIFHKHPVADIQSKYVTQCKGVLSNYGHFSKITTWKIRQWRIAIIPPWNWKGVSTTLQSVGNTLTIQNCRSVVFFVFFPVWTDTLSIDVWNRWIYKT